jgi:LCP family protein required for cell wall assembly
MAGFLFVAGVAALSFLNLNDGGFVGDLFSQLMPNQPVNILVLGGDKVNNNTDTIMLVNYNPSSAQMNILSIPRDTKVNIKGKGTEKINFAFPYGGAKLSVETVSNLLDVNIKYYVFVDTSAFRKIVDELGGVDYNIPANMDYDDPLQNLHIHLKKGQQHLDGAKAEQFMRFRQASHSNKEISRYYDGSDLKRIDAQQNFIKEFIRQKVNIFYITKLNKIAGIIFSNIETNIKLNDALKMLQNIGKLKADTVQFFKLPGNSDYEAGGWYYIMDGKQAEEITKKYFNAAGSFVDGSNTAGAADKNANTGNPKKKPKNNDSAAKNMSKDNPSNAESSIQGTTRADP